MNTIWNSRLNHEAAIVQVKSLRILVTSCDWVKCLSAFVMWDCTESWEGCRRCGHVHLEKAGESGRAAGRGGFETYVVTAVMLWEILKKGKQLGLKTYFGKSKNDHRKHAWEEIGSLIISSVSGMDCNHSLMKSDWIAVIAAFLGGQAVHSLIEVALSVSWFLVFQSSCHFLRGVTVFSLYAI